MTERLTERWRREVADQEAAVAAGALPAEAAYAARVWPAPFIAAVDTALATFEREITRIGAGAADEAVWEAVESVVRSLNLINESLGGHIDTITREDLCEYIDAFVTRSGIDAEALTARRGRGAHELTDERRDW